MSKKRTYREGEWGVKVGWGDRPATIVIDLQYSHTDPTSELGTQRLMPVVENTKELLDEARKKNIPIVFVNTRIRADGADYHWIGRRIPISHKWQLDGTRWTQIDRRLEPQEKDIYIVKKLADSFFGTPLDFMLRNLGIDTLIITGCSTSGCVRATVETADHLGYRNIIPEECVGERSEEAHQCNLFDIRKRYADVVPLDEVLDHIRRMSEIDYRPLWRQSLEKDIDLNEIEAFIKKYKA